MSCPNEGEYILDDLQRIYDGFQLLHLDPLFLVGMVYIAIHGHNAISLGIVD